ncbi:MAG: zinc-binding alcohol dehydrogenase [Chloroflexia bacterium]|nr:zinc-binding alcohol dehydrogenase [Chloroflexia bacterium]
MPRELIATAPRTPELRDYDDPPLKAAQIRIRTELASPKHGTELVAYRDDPVASRPYDPAWGAVIPKPPEQARAGFPMRLGNMAVGVVTETGPDVSRFKAGDRVFGHFPIRETQTVDETRADPLPDGLSARAALCLDPVVMALAIRDAGIALGDRVAVFGLGAIGLVALQLARLAGADQVIAVDPLANRREIARALGADIALDPTAGDGDAGLAIRRLGLDGPSPVPLENRLATPLLGGYTERATQDHQLGVDVALETSGSIAALGGAIRATRFGGTVCVVSFYGRDAAGLSLGEEFHINQLRLISVRAESLPMRDAPAWTLERMVRLGLDWLTSGRVRTDGIIDPIVPFADAADAYRMIDEHPERSIKLGIRFP